MCGVATKAEIQAGIDRQNRVIDALADLMTSDKLSSEDLRHYAVVRYAFGPQFDETLSRLVDCEFGHPEHARNLLVGLLLHTLERLLSPPPDAVEVRQPRKSPVKPKSDVCRSTRRYRAMIAAMSPEELEAFRIEERATPKGDESPENANALKSVYTCGPDSH